MKVKTEMKRTAARGQYEKHVTFLDKEMKGFRAIVHNPNGLMSIWRKGLVVGLYYADDKVVSFTAVDKWDKPAKHPVKSLEQAVRFIFLKMQKPVKPVKSKRDVKKKA